MTETPDLLPKLHALKKLWATIFEGTPEQQMDALDALSTVIENLPGPINAAAWKKANRTTLRRARAAGRKTYAAMLPWEKRAFTVVTQERTRTRS